MNAAPGGGGGSMVLLEGGGYMVLLEGGGGLYGAPGGGPGGYGQVRRCPVRFSLF